MIAHSSRELNVWSNNELDHRPPKHAMILRRVPMMMKAYTIVVCSRPADLSSRPRVYASCCARFHTLPPHLDVTRSQQANAQIRML